MAYAALQNLTYHSKISTTITLKSFIKGRHLYFETRNFIVKIASTKEEIKEAIFLRCFVFQQEFNASLHENTEYNSYDRKSDIIIIIEKKTAKIVATCRLITGKNSKKFYSSTEFKIDSFIQYDHLKKTELSRFCIHPLYRKGDTLLTLWRAIYKYVKKYQSSYLFGMSSIPQTDVSKIFGLIYYIQKKNLEHKLLNRIYPKRDYACSEYLLSKLNYFNFNVFNEDVKLPPLLQLYLKFGASVSSIPAKDPIFHCYDFFTVLPTHSLHRHLSKKWV